MFNSAHFHQYRNDEYIQFCKDVQQVCEQANPETLQVKEQLDIMKTGTVKMETAYLQTKGSELTKKITAEDDVRDIAINGISKMADAYTHHYNTEFVEAGERILSHIKKYGTSIAEMNYQAETTALTDLIDFVKNDEKLNAAVTVLNMNEWFTKLEESNTEFNSLYMQRIDEEAGKPKLNLKELRKESVGYYRKLTDHLQAYATVNPSDLYESTINKFNELTDKYNHIRKKKKGNTTDDENTED